MKKVSKDTFYPTIKNCMSHRARSIAQFAKLGKEMSYFTNKNAVYGLITSKRHYHSEQEKVKSNVSEKEE